MFGEAVEEVGVAAIHNGGEVGGAFDEDELEQRLRNEYKQGAGRVARLIPLLLVVALSDNAGRYPSRIFVAAVTAKGVPSYTRKFGGWNS